MNIRVAFYACTSSSGHGSLDIAYHDPRARDRMVEEISTSTGARFVRSLETPLDELVRRGTVGVRTAADWTRRCALRGACRAYGLSHGQL